MVMDNNNWTQVPQEVFGEILNRLPITDMDAFKNVCKSWYSAFRQEANLSLLRPLASPPLLTCFSSVAHYSDVSTFYNPVDNKLYSNDNNIVIGTTTSSTNKRKINRSWWYPPPEEAVCVGSCYGWLAFIDTKCVIYLQNPFRPVRDDDYKIASSSSSSSVIKLPPIETLPSILSSSVLSTGGIEYTCLTPCLNYNYVRNAEELYNSLVTKVVMSASASELECRVMMIYSEANGGLAVCKPGDKSWTPLKGKLRRNTDLYYSDSSQQFYVFCALDDTVEVWDLSNFSQPKSTVINVPTELSEARMFNHAHVIYRWRSPKVYLAEVDNKLMLVVRYFIYRWHENFSYKTYDFDVYKLEGHGVKKHWVHVKGLGEDVVLFLGNNNALTFSTCDFPGLEGDSIYFTDDDRRYYGGGDMGIFGFKHKSITPCYSPTRNVRTIRPRPVWVSPNPW